MRAGIGRAEVASESGRESSQRGLSGREREPRGRGGRPPSPRPTQTGCVDCATLHQSTLSHTRLSDRDASIVRMLLRPHEMRSAGAGALDSTFCAVKTPRCAGVQSHLNHRLARLVHHHQRLAVVPTTHWQTHERQRRRRILRRRMQHNLHIALHLAAVRARWVTLRARWVTLRARTLGSWRVTHETFGRDG